MISLTRANVRVKSTRRSSHRRPITCILCAALFVLLPQASGNRAYAHDDCPAVIVLPFVVDCPQTSGCRQENGSCIRRAIDLVLFGFGIRFCHCNCPDSNIQASFVTHQPILSFPATRIFHPSGNWGIQGVSPHELTVTAAGNMIVLFELDTHISPPLVRATIQSFSIQIFGLPIGENEAHLLKTETPFIGVENTRMHMANLVTNPSLLFLNPTDGSTNGVIGTLFTTEERAFSFKGEINGVLDFERGLWSWSVDGTQCPAAPDVHEQGQ